MSVVDDAFAALADIRIALTSSGQIGCHVFIFSPRTRERSEEWLKIAMSGAVADHIMKASRDSVLRVEARASDDQALADFNFDTMADGAIGVMLTAEVPAIAEWLEQVPSDDWRPRGCY